MMDMKLVVEQHPVLGILRKISDDDLLDYAQACLSGGVNFFEVALNSPNGLEQISRLRTHFGDQVLVGAGTVLTPDQAQAAADHGAQFLLSPSCPEKVLDWCRKQDVAYLPGVMTPSDVGLCLSYGFSTLKLFPAGSLAGNYVKNLKGPFDATEYVAIGGVDFSNAADFFRQGYLGIGLGSNLFPKDAVAARDWQAASEALKACMAGL